jgi:hypothetical protein
MSANASTGSPLFTVSAAARARGLYARRLWNAIRAGDLPAFQVGHWLRVRIEDLDAWVESQRYDPNQKPRLKEAAGRASRAAAT